MKFSLVSKGARAEQASSFRFRNEEVLVLFRPLTLAEEMAAETEAIRACKTAGAEPKPGTPIYEAARMAAILVAGCLDPDSPPGARTSLFDGGSDQVCADLDTDTIGLLYGQHQAWQEQCSPSYRQKTDGQLFTLAKQLAEDAETDPLAYWRQSPKTQLSLLHFMGALLRRSLVSSSTPGGSSDSSPTRSGGEPSPPSPPEASSNSPTPSQMPDGAP